MPTDTDVETPARRPTRRADRRRSATPSAETPAGPTTRRAPLPVDIEALSQLWREVATAPETDEYAMRTKAEVVRKLRSLNHDQKHPDCPLVEVDVPRTVTNGLFSINTTPYIGHVVVPRCVAQQLLWQIDQNRRVEADRMREGGRTIDLGAVAARARAIQAEV